MGSAPPDRSMATSPAASDHSNGTGQIVEVDSVEGMRRPLGSYSSYSLTTSDKENYEELDGRTYTRNKEGGIYLYPNDDSEQERLEMHHYLNRLIKDDSLHLCPYDGTGKVLDVACGTGAWCVDMGDTYEDAKIQGTDITPVQPPIVPENVSFYVDDATEEDWLYEDGEFDLIYTTNVLGTFPNFYEIMQRAFKYVKPGGYMECLEILPTMMCDDGSMPHDWKLAQWARDHNDAQMRLGLPIRIGPKLKDWMQRCGFVDVHERVVKAPIGPWARDPHYKTIGFLSGINYKEGLSAWSTQVFKQALGWTRLETEVYLAEAKACLSDMTVHAYNKTYVVYGRKPRVGEVVTSPRTAASIAQAVSSSASSRPARSQK